MSCIRKPEKHLYNIRLHLLAVICYLRKQLNY